MKATLTILLILMLVPVLPLLADSPGTIGFQFLRTQVGARPSAMGGAFLAIPGDVHNVFYNPAGIMAIKERSAAFSYLNDLLDFATGSVGFVQPKLGPGTLGAGILYKDYGEFVKTDITGEEIGTFGANSIALSAVYAIEPYPNLHAGASAKYIRAAIDNYSADAVAMDAGVMFTIPSQMLTFAAGVFNLGSATSAFITTKDDLPFNFRAGVSKRLAHLPLLIGFNVYKYSEEIWHGAVGGEFTLTDYLFLRLGYDNRGRDLDVGSTNDHFAGAAVGMGLLWRELQFDYAFTSYGEMGSLNRFSISGRF